MTASVVQDITCLVRSLLLSHMTLSAAALLLCRRQWLEVSLLMFPSPCGRLCAEVPSLADGCTCMSTCTHRRAVRVCPGLQLVRAWKEVLGCFFGNSAGGQERFSCYLYALPVTFPAEFDGDGEGSAPPDVRSKRESSPVAGWLKPVAYRVSKFCFSL